MRRLVILLTGFLLFPLLTYGQQANWEAIEKPYFVYNATGVSVGWQDNTQYTYMITSDLEDILAYCSDEVGAVYWPPERQVQITGATRVSASREYGRYAAAIVPYNWDYQNPEKGVHFTNNGGQSWYYIPDDGIHPPEQPPAVDLTCVAMHPLNTQFCVAGALEQPEGWAPHITSWRTTNGGLTWSVLLPNGNHNEETYSIRFHPRTDPEPENTNLFVCRQNSGLYATHDGGSFWWNHCNTDPIQRPYDALDVAICPQHLGHYYLLIRTSEENYELWFSESGYHGPWNLVRDFGEEAIFEIIATSQSDDENLPDTLWAISKDNLYMYDEDVWQTFPANGNQYSWIDYTPSGIGVSHPTVYIGRQYSFEQLAYNTDYLAWMNLYKVDGTNQAYLANISEGIGEVQNGGGLYCIAENGGYVFINKKLRDPNWPNDWEFKGSLSDVPASSDIGIDISTYYDGPDVKYIAIGYDDDLPLPWVASNNGQAVTFDDAPGRLPSSLDACTGKRSLFSEITGHPHIAGKWGSDQYNLVWRLTSETYANRFYEDFTPFFRDIILLENVNEQEFKPLGVGGWGPWGQNVAVYIIDFFNRIYLNEGLEWIDTVRCVTESEERSGDGISVLYTAAHGYTYTEGGVYKNHFDHQNSSPWYQVNYGIPYEIEIISVISTKHLIDCDEQLDPIVVYALGIDPQDYDAPYVYVSPDSGRSWNEFGQYLREIQFDPKHLELIKDSGTAQEYFLAVAGEDGIYRYPYNVKSGPIYANETWGPGKVIVNGDITVNNGVTLEIAAPCTVLVVYDFDVTQSGAIYKSEIVIEGELIALGSDDDSIVFMSSEPVETAPDDWLGLCFKEESQGTLEYCTIRDALSGIEMSYNSNITLSHCLIKDIGMRGIGNSRGILVADNCTFVNIGNKGVYSSEAVSDISYCEFNQCDDYGVYIDSHPSGDYDSTKITNCSIQTYEDSILTGSQYGIRADDIDKIRIEDNLIRTYEQGGIKLYNSDAFVKGNEICNCDYYGIHALQNSDAKIDSCDFDTLHTGIYLNSGSDPKVRWCLFDSVSIGSKDFGNSFPNLGTINPDDKGYNDFQGCINYYIYHDPKSQTTIWAQGNYFGGMPNPEKFVGNPVYFPWLTEDPYPKLTGEQPIPFVYKLNPNFPNPFNPNTTISFSLAEPGYTKVVIYNILGQKVITLVDDYRPPGEYSITWNGYNDKSEPVSTGIYFYRIESGSFVETKKMTIIR